MAGSASWVLSDVSGRVLKCVDISVGTCSTFFALLARERSKVYAVVPGSKLQYGAPRVSEVPKPVVYLYLSDVYCSWSTASLLAGRIRKAIYVVLSLGAFLRVGQYGSVSRFGHDQMRSACASQGALLRVLWALVSQWFCYGLFGILKEMDVDPVLALSMTACAAEAERNAKPDLDWFPITLDKGLISFLSASAFLRLVSVFESRPNNVAGP